MRFQLLRVAYAVMLGALLVTPFGVYHTRVEPYLTGYLWGYNLPVGYIGLLLGIAVVLYPRLHAFRRLRLSAFLSLIGLFLFLTFLLSPKDYFINIFNGTNFSPAQIDVDFALGNSAVLSLSILSIAFGLVSFIRGWLPKESNLNGVKRTMGRRNLVNEPVLGVVLVSLGVTALLFSILIATRADTVIDRSFVLESDEESEPYKSGTYYHTHVISKSTLLGEVIVDGGNVNFTGNGYNTQYLKNICISQNYSLVIKPADDKYTLIFENTGVDPSTIKFTLKEKWMPFFALAPAFVILLILTLMGTALIISGLRKKPN
jgi:hypothetical protein